MLTAAAHSWHTDSRKWTIDTNGDQQRGVSSALRPFGLAVVRCCRLTDPTCLEDRRPLTWSTGGPFRVNPQESAESLERDRGSVSESFRHVADNRFASAIYCFLSIRVGDVAPLAWMYEGGKGNWSDKGDLAHIDASDTAERHNLTSERRTSDVPDPSGLGGPFTFPFRPDLQSFVFDSACWLCDDSRSRR